MEFWAGILDAAVQGIIQIGFCWRFTGKRFEFRALAVYLASVCLIQAFGGKAAVLLELLVLYSVNRLFLKNGPWASGAAGVIAVYITQLSFGLVNSLGSLVFPFVAGKAAMLLSVMCELLSLAISSGFCVLAGRRFGLGEDFGDFRLLLPPCLFFLVSEMFILDMVYTAPAGLPARLEAGRHLSLMAVQTLGLAALFCTLYACRRVCEGFRARRSMELLAQELRAQENYAAQAQARYERTRAFRHDLQNHLSVLDGLLKGGEAEQAREYLDKLGASARELSLPVRTGSTLLNVLLGDKLALAEGLGIDWDVSLSLPETGMDGPDLCLIFANALDNAIAACAELEGRRYIRVSGERQGDFYMLEFENSCAPGPRKPMGVGLSNIRRAAEKCGGTVMIENSGSVFRLNVLLDISLHQNDSSGQKD